METPSFFLHTKTSLENAKNLSEVESILSALVNEVERDGKKLGFVVGKITPNVNETLDENKMKLAKQTQEIAKIVEPEGIVVFSSAAIPDSIEGKFPLDDFYRVFDTVIRNHVKIIFTTPGWQQSHGATNEVKIAEENGLEIKHFVNGAFINRADPN
jgi:hypothetical protein